MNIKLEDWIKTHHLIVKKICCTSCGKIIKTDKPFISKEWIGVAAICECGFHAGSSMFAKSSDMQDAISSLFFCVENSEKK